VNEDWDVEQHKVEYESDEHWELRRKFLLAHKDKFTEDMLVCLAQVFVNIELLGCRYRCLIDACHSCIFNTTFITYAFILI